MAKKNFYVVLKGHEIGIFKTWSECLTAVNGYSGALYKGFGTEEDILNDIQFKEIYNLLGNKKTTSKSETIKNNDKSAVKEYIEDSIAVDGACSGNPGLGEYQCVSVETEEVIFHHSEFENTTNNIMEFLALVEVLKYTLKLQKKDRKIIYTDSITAMAWVRNRKAKSTLEKLRGNEDSFLAIQRDEKWLKDNDDDLKLVESLITKWDTKKWGEIPADFGRK